MTSHSEKLSQELRYSYKIDEPKDDACELTLRLDAEEFEKRTCRGETPYQDALDYADARLEALGVGGIARWICSIQQGFRRCDWDEPYREALGKRIS